MARQPKSQAAGRDRRRARRVDSAKLLTLAEVDALRTWAVAAAARGDREGVLVLTLLGTGGRRFEVAALRCGDVRRSVSGEPEVFFPQTKGGKTATVPITPSTAAVLATWIAARGSAASSTAPLFVSGRGGFMACSTLWRAFRRALRAAGIKRRAGVHASRHAAGLLVLRATLDIAKVQAFLRHESRKTTEDWYQHIHLPDLRAGMSKAGL